MLLFFVSISITPNPLRIRPFRVARKHAGTGETPHRLVRYALSIGGEGDSPLFVKPAGGLFQALRDIPQAENFGLHKVPPDRVRKCLEKFSSKAAMPA